MTVTLPPRGVLVAVGLALAGLLGAAVTRPDAPQVAAQERATVVGATAVCPGPRPAAGATTTVTLATAPQEGAAGTVSAGVPGEDQRPLLAGPGESRVGVRLGLDEPLLVRARGTLAGGLTAVQRDLAIARDQAGLAASACVTPSGQWWFVGAATTVGAYAQLVLTNVDEVAAAVDVSALTAAGSVSPRLGRDIVVGPGTRRIVSVDDLVPDEPTLAVRVVARTGRVAAALRQTRARGLTAYGVEWLPAEQVPAPELVIAGIPPAPARRVLVLANSDSLDLTAEISVTTATGQQVPEGLDLVEVIAGSTAQVDLTAALGASAGAVRVRADSGALLAAVVAEEPGATRDVSWAGATAPLDGPSLVPVEAGAPVTVVLSALDRDGSVLVAPLGGGSPRRVAVPAGRTVTVPTAPLLGGRPGLVVVTAEGSAPVVAGWYARQVVGGRPYLTGLRLTGAAGGVLVPPVHRDPLVSSRTRAD